MLRFDAINMTTVAARKMVSNFILFISVRMSYNIFISGRGLVPLPLLKSLYETANPARNVPGAMSSFVISSVRLFCLCFLLLVPYLTSCNYNIIWCPIYQ